MQGGRQGRDPFDDPFFTSPFGSNPFSSFGVFGGNGEQRSLASSFFGGRNPFDDPFFTRPFGGIFGSMESSLFSRSQFPNIAPPGFIEQRAFPNTATPGFIEERAFPNMVPYGFMEQQTFPNMAASGIDEQESFPNMAPSGSDEHRGPQPKRQRGLIIEEINSDEENDEENKKKNGSTKKDSSSHDVHYVEYPDDRVNERSRHLLAGNGHNSQFGHIQQQPPNRSFTFQSSTVTIGGANGPYYSSSTTRRTGSDGMTFEERKEADSTTREATHKIHRGLHDKGHSVARKLNSDGKVDTRQILHNLNEDELAGFQESWKNNAERHLPGLDRNSFGSGAGSSAQSLQASQGALALPSKECPRGTSRRRLM